MGYSQCRFSELSAIIDRNCSRLDQKGALKRGWEWSERELLFGPHNLSHPVHRGPRASALPSHSRRSISSVGRSAGCFWEAQLYGDHTGRRPWMPAG